MPIRIDSIKPITPPIQVISKSRKAILEIDQYEVFANLGFKNPKDLLRESVHRTYEHVMEFISKTSADGDILGSIELGGTPIADIAENNAFLEKTFGTGPISYGAPKIDIKYVTKVYNNSGEMIGANIDRFL